MAILKALPVPGAPDVRDEPVQICENPTCGRSGKSSMMINFIPVIGSPGHPDLAPFQCGCTEHWACSRECWLIVAHACIDEHMFFQLEEAQQTVGR
jgi:hypothetical protein